MSTSTMSQSSTFFFTPSLMMGDLPRGLSRARRVGGPQEALTAIRQGFVAVLPHEAWTAARDVLTGLGLSQFEVMQRLNLARGGTLSQF